MRAIDLAAASIEQARLVPEFTDAPVATQGLKLRAVFSSNKRLDLESCGGAWLPGPGHSCMTLLAFPKPPLNPAAALPQGKVESKSRLQAAGVAPSNKLSDRSMRKRP